MNTNDLDHKVEIGRLCDYYGNLLSERQRDMVVCYYNDDLSLGEIAELFGITRQGVRDALKKSEALLRSYEEKLRLIERFDAISHTISEVLELLDQKCDPEEAVRLLKKISV